MQTTGAVTFTLSPGSQTTILDPGGNEDYQSSCSSTLTLVSPSHSIISIYGTYNTEYNTDFIRIFEGHTCNGVMLGYYSGIGIIDLQSTTGAVTIQFTSNDYIEQSGFSLTVSVCGIPVNQPVNVAVSDIDTNSATITWNDPTNASSWTVHYGLYLGFLDSIVYTTTPSCHIENLQPYTHYLFQIYNGHGDTTDICTSPLYRLQTHCPYPQPPCIDYSNLSSCYTTATYGNIHDPNIDIGVIDFGSSSSNSRHTVHTDTAERDPRTGNLLRTVPQGYSSSVRLGNWQTGSQAESLTYEYTVDTVKSDLLIMKYAAVLQEPGHEPRKQPSFSFKFFDNEMNELNSSCYSANFVADSNLGWNVSYDSTGSWWSQGTVLWKDWTTIGIDLSSLHGESIRMRLTTRDCAHSQHYGYAYFVFDCANKTLMSENCGCDVENNFTAPEGFNYRWYNNDSAWVTLSTSRSLHVTQAGLYKCVLSFIGAPAGANCSFVLSALAGERYPAASFTVDSLPRDGCDLPVVLHNTSRISTDSLHQSLTALPCEHITWIVDSNVVSSDDEITVLLTPGSHTVGIVASLASGGCTDTAWRSIEVYDPCLISDTIVSTICQGDSVILLDTVVYLPGVYERHFGHLRRTLFLTVNRIDDTSIFMSLPQNDIPFSWNGYSVTIDSLNFLLDSTEFNFIYRTTNSLGCDSTVRLELHVRHNSHTVVDSTLCENSLPLHWNGVTFTASDTTTVILPNASLIGTDSIITMIVTVLHNSTAEIHDTIVQNQLPYSWHQILFTADSLCDTLSHTAFHSQITTVNAAGCDSIVSHHLVVWHNVGAATDSSICENSLPMVWNGQTFSSDSTVTVNLATVGIHASHGQDSTLTMTLHILRNTSYSFYDTIVENDLPYSWDHFNFSADNLNDGYERSLFTSHFTTTNAAGCDSNVSFSLLVWHNYSMSFARTVCDSELPLTWCDTVFTEEGVKTLLYTSMHGSDSSVTLSLNVNPTYQVYDSVSICDGQTAPFGYTDSGDYTMPFLSVNGCDSILHLTVKVNPVYSFVTSDTICDNQSVIFDGNAVSTGGIHQVIHTSVAGCDSMLTLNLTVNPTYHLTERIVICNNTPFTWIDGQTYMGSTYEPNVTLTDINGCDSSIRLILDIDSSFKASMVVSPTTVSNEHPEVYLRDISRSGSRTWFASDFSDTARSCVFIFPSSEDSVSVLLVARSYAGCADSVRATVSADRSVIWVPNAFTPDESTNERFFIQSNGLASGEVWIYDRKGMVVAHFDALSGWWDGTSRGRICPQASYTWILKYTTTAQSQITRQAKGTVTLLR